MIRWHLDGYEVVFTTRVGGVSEGPYASLNLGRKSGDDVERVDENRRIACESIGADLEKLALNYQVHSDRVLRAAPRVRGEQAMSAGAACSQASSRRERAPSGNASSPPQLGRASVRAATTWGRRSRRHSVSASVTMSSTRAASTSGRAPSERSAPRGSSA